jgi:hypothetical protein
MSRIDRNIWSVPEKVQELDLEPRGITLEKDQNMHLAEHGF